MNFCMKGIIEIEVEAEVEAGRVTVLETGVTVETEIEAIADLDQENTIIGNKMLSVTFVGNPGMF